jgi:ferrous iron transport protein A
MAVMTLDMLKPGDFCTISAYSLRNFETDALMEMGLLTGTPVEIIKYAPLGDPVEIRFRGYHLSIRKSIARNIEIEKVESTI